MIGEGKGEIILTGKIKKNLFLERENKPMRAVANFPFLTLISFKFINEIKHWIFRV